MIARNRGETAGLPALTPGLRSVITKAGIDAERNRQLLKDDIGRESATVARDGDLDVTSKDQQIGLPMSASEIKRRLLLCNPNLHFEISIHDASKTGIYVMRNNEGKLEKQFVCGMMSGLSPERSVRVHKWTKIPNPDNSGEWLQVKTIQSEIRGWRTILGILLRCKFVTQPQIDRLFPTSDGKSQNWQLITT